jgi:T4-like virus tail tube protein gp19.
MAQPLRQDTWRLAVRLNGNMIYDLDFDKKTGGEYDSDDTKYYPGNMGDSIALGGRKTVGNVTLQRIYLHERDHDNVQKWLEQVGKGRVQLNQIPLDKNGNPYPDQTNIQYSGILKRVLVPEVDSEASGAAMLEIEFSPDGPITQV